jgi:uncharacterized protein (TIGR02266 family)
VKREAPGDPPEDVLLGLRVPLVRRVELGVDGKTLHAYTLDVGLRGVFVEWSEPPPVGAEVALSFHLPGSERPLAAQSRVAWHNPPGESARARRLPGGAGLEFAELADRDRRRIRALVLEHWRGDTSSRRFHPAWPATPGEGPARAE